MVELPEKSGEFEKDVATSRADIVLLGFSSGFEFASWPALDIFIVRVQVNTGGNVQRC